jgi:hypothetical protein
VVGGGGLACNAIVKFTRALHGGSEKITWEKKKSVHFGSIARVTKNMRDNGIFESFAGFFSRSLSL